MSKEACKLHLEQQFKKFSDSARKNVATEIDIPAVGHLSIKNNIAGVLFNPKLIEETRGKTAKHF